jgi:hypothetical protein
MSGPFTITLREPVQAHGQELAAVTLRPPKGADIAACGYPLLLLGDGTGVDAQAQPDARAVTKYIARLGDVPPSTVNQLSASDWQACMLAVVGFFEV